MVCVIEVAIELVKSVTTDDIRVASNYVRTKVVIYEREGVYAELGRPSGVDDAVEPSWGSPSCRELTADFGCSWKTTKVTSIHKR